MIQGESHRLKQEKRPACSGGRSALVLRKVSDFGVDGFKGRQGLPSSDAAPILVEDVDRGVIRNSEAAEGSRRLVHVRGIAARDITVSGSRVPSGAVVATFERSDLRRGVRVLAGSP